MHQNEMEYYPIVVDDMKLNNVISMGRTMVLGVM